MKEEKRKGELMTINANDFMKILGLSRNTFKKELRAGKLPKPLPMAGSCRRWAIDDVKNYLNSNKTTTEL